MSFYNRNVYTNYVPPKPSTQPLQNNSMYRPAPVSNPTTHVYSNQHPRHSNSSQLLMQNGSMRRNTRTYSPAPNPGLQHRASQQSNVYNQRAKSSIKTVTNHARYSNRSQDPLMRMQPSV